MITGYLGEFCGEISDIPDTLLIRVEAEGFKTSEWKYPAKEKGDNYLTIQILPTIKMLNEVIFSSGKIQVKLKRKILDIHHFNINEEGWNEEEIAIERIMIQTAIKNRTYYAGFWENHHPELVKHVEQWGYVGQVKDYMNRRYLPYARVRLIDGKDTIRLTCYTLGYFSWKTSKNPAVLLSIKRDFIIRPIFIPYKKRIFAH